MERFFEELKRRKVFKVGAVYLIAGWVAIQIADATFPDLNIPDSAQTVVLLAVLAGFPVALVLAWIFDITPGGIVRTPPADAPGHGTGNLRQEIRFCTTPDGVRLAYATVGEGPILVKTANWLNHLEYDWESPVWSHMFRELASENRLVRYDERGTGLSEWDVDDISFDAFCGDVETVVDAAGLDRFALFGVSQGAAIAIAYAADHPEKVSHLILYGGFHQGVRVRGTPEEIEVRETVTGLIKTGWGNNNPAFRQLFTSTMIPGASAEQMNWYNELQHRTATPETAVRIRHAIDGIDLADMLGAVTSPTLVLHCRGDASVPVECGRRIAAGIPGARFVELEGNNHLILEDEPAWPRFMDEVRAFLAEDKEG